MAYQIVSPAGVREPGYVSSVAEVPVGTVGVGVDTASEPRKMGEFVYLKGVASTAEGKTVVYNLTTGATALTAAASRGPVAVAMGATVANTYGWYQVSGTAKVKAGDVAIGASAYSTATPGTVDDVAVSGDKIDGVVFATEDADGFAYANINRPSMNGNDVQGLASVALSDLTDVDIDTPVTGQVLKYDTDHWENAADATE